MGALDVCILLQHAVYAPRVADVDVWIYLRGHP
jgi:hypothetical protein